MYTCNKAEEEIESLSAMRSSRDKPHQHLLPGRQEIRPLSDSISAELFWFFVGDETVGPYLQAMSPMGRQKSVVQKFCIFTLRKNDDANVVASTLIITIGLFGSTRGEHLITSEGVLRTYKSSLTLITPDPIRVVLQQGIQWLHHIRRILWYKLI